MQFGEGYDEAAVFAVMRLELSSRTIVFLITRWTQLFFAQFTTYLTLELLAVDCEHRFVESRDDTVGARLIPRIRQFTRLESTVWWEVCGH